MWVFLLLLFYTRLTVCTTTPNFLNRHSILRDVHHKYKIRCAMREALAYIYRRFLSFRNLEKRGLERGKHFYEFLLTIRLPCSPRIIAKNKKLDFRQSL